MLPLAILTIVCAITYSFEIVFGLAGTILMLPLLSGPGSRAPLQSAPSAGARLAEITAIPIEFRALYLSFRASLTY